jgi:hypothetical protein
MPKRTLADCFMQPEVTVKMTGYEVETDNGTEYLPGDVVERMTPGGPTCDDVAMYVEGEPQSVRTVHGYFARLSAPGYMDCTPWHFYTNKREAVRETVADALGED